MKHLKIWLITDIIELCVSILFFNIKICFIISGAGTPRHRTQDHEADHTPRQSSQV